jgi:hypothetical protein
MSALVNGWERWEPNDAIRKGKEALNTQWTIIQNDRAARARREGLEEDEDGSDYDDGYSLDMYSDEEMPFYLDKANLRKVTGWNNSISIGEGYDNDHGNGDDDKEQYRI